MDFECFFDNSIDFVCCMTSEGFVMRLNRRWSDALGWTDEELSSRPIYSFLHPDDSTPCSVELERVVDGGEIVAFDNRIMRKDGSSLWVQWNLAPMGDGLLAVTARDIEDMVTARQRLAEQKQLLELAAGIANVGHWRLDLRRRDLTWSANTYAIFGVSSDDFIPCLEQVLAMHHPADSERVRKKLEEVQSQTGSTTFKSRIYRPKGELRHIQTKAMCELGPDDHPVALFGVVQDITEHEEAIKAVEHAALHDPLTNLANRTKFHDRLIQALKRGERDGRGTGLMLLDLDHFKDVNDAFGHPFGDKLLLEVASRLRQNVREPDTIARLGGDEFAVIIEPITAANDIMPLAQRLLGALGTPYVIDGQEVRSGVSIGVAIEPEGRRHSLPCSRTADQLIANADIALYTAKRQGRHGYSVFNQDMRFVFEEQQQMDRDLRIALAEDQFTLHFQPQINHCSHRLLGFEALIRWQHPEKGLVPPNAFLPQVERNNLLLSLTDWVIGEACRQQLRLQEQGLVMTPIAVNIAPVSLRATNLTHLICRHLERCGLERSSLIVEITEDALADGDEAAKALHQLKEAGLKVALDDFGAGYSSLARLRELPIDILKLDRSFVNGIDVDTGQAALAEAIIRLAQGLDLKLIAEGVETEAQLAALGNMGCENVQGFLTGRPMESVAVPKWLADWSADASISAPYPKLKPVDTGGSHERTRQQLDDAYH